MRWLHQLKLLYSIHSTIKATQLPECPSHSHTKMSSSAQKPTRQTAAHEIACICMYACVCVSNPLTGRNYENYAARVSGGWGCFMLVVHIWDTPDTVENVCGIFACGRMHEFSKWKEPPQHHTLGIIFRPRQQQQKGPGQASQLFNEPVLTPTVRNG